jgi:hypothetical protein
VAAPLRATALDVATELLGLTPTSAGTDPVDVVGLVGPRGRSRFLLPLASAPATRAACLAYVGLRDRRTIARRVAVAGAFAAGLGGRVAPERLAVDRGPHSLLVHLADLLGRPEVPMVVAMGLGRVDTVWKPTLQLFELDGTPAAFVKVGRGPVASALVQREVEALAAWQDHPDPRLVVPDLLATGTWRGQPFVAVAPLPADARRLPAPVSSWAVRTLDPPVANSSLDRSSWWSHQREMAARSTAHHADLLARVEDRHADVDHAWARWHGDWVPWNLARCSRGLVAWDWEYSEAEAPVGLDDVHGRYQQHHVVQGRSIAEALAGTKAPSLWLADAHVAMLVARDAELGLLGGVEPDHRGELLEAADEALR